MHWIQIILETSHDKSAQLEESLMAQGALAVTYVDAGDQPLFEPGPGETPLWEAIRIVGLFPADAPMNAVTEQLKQEFGGDCPNHRIEILEDKDWIREWMDQFEPMKFGDRLWICPSWRKAPDPGAVNLMLDPGLAFGSGTHATTTLCLQWLDSAQLEHLSVIDYGCGSGVLGIAALLLGCKQLCAIDIDPQALLATKQNAAQNSIAEQRIAIYHPNHAPREPADILLANILAGPLTELAPAISSLVKHNGQLVLSGILSAQANSVIAAYQPWFDFEPVKELDGWVLLAGNKTR